MKKSTFCLILTTILFFGIIIGFLLSPIKNGVFMVNDSGNDYHK